MLSEVSRVQAVELLAARDSASADLYMVYAGVDCVDIWAAGQYLRIPMKAATRSEGKRPAIPIESGHPPDRSEATTRGRSLGLCCTCFSVG